MLFRIQHDIPSLSAENCTFFLTEEKIRDLNQEQDKKPLPPQNLCNEKGCYSNPEAEETERSAVPQELPAFFSLAALAEVAAMENVHRYRLTPAIHLVVIPNMLLYKEEPATWTISMHTF